MAGKVLAVALNLAFLLLVFSLGFAQPAFRIAGYPIPITDFIFIGTFGIWIATVLLGITRFHWNRFYVFLLVYLASMMLSTIFSGDIKQSLIKLVGEFLLLGLALLTINVVRSLDSFRMTIFAWLSATAFACVISVATMLLFYIDRDNFLLNYTLSHYGTLPPGNYPRVRGSFLNANMLSNYLNVGTVFLLAAHKLKWVGPKVFVFLLSLFLAANFLTISFGIGGVFLCLGLWVWMDRVENDRRRMARTSLTLGLLVSCAFLLSLLVAPATNPLAEFQTEIFGVQIHSSERVSAWLDALRTINENPAVGRGLGLNAVEAYSYDASGNLHMVSDAHQVWLNFGAQTGTIGLLAIGILTMLLFLRSLPLAFRGLPHDILRVACGLAFIGAFMYQGLGGSYEDARHLWVLFGLLVVASDANV